MKILAYIQEGGSLQCFRDSGDPTCPNMLESHVLPTFRVRGYQKGPGVDCVIYFVCINQIIGSKPTKVLGSAQQLWGHKWGVVSLAESQETFKEEVAFELVKDEKGG